jgi:hypothetical protein
MCVAAALCACARLARAGAPGNPGSGTSAPAAPLSTDQARAIADKDAARLAHERAVAAQLPGAQAMHVVDGKLVPVDPPVAALSVTRAPGARLRLPMISPAIGAIPRPEWRVPPQPPKTPDITVIGDRRVPVTTSGAAPAGTERRP